MTPDEFCQRRAAASGSSFYYSFVFLPERRRRAITALYAFCREVDDVVDETDDPGVARVKLAWWRDEIARAFEGRAQHPVALALQAYAPEFGLERRLLLEVLDGMQMDLDQNRYHDYAGLQLYCHRVAGVVGMLAAGIFGTRTPEVAAYAERLGQAFQLTNIIRDVGEDARKGRIYLPLEDLRKFDVTPHEIISCTPSERFLALMRFEAERTRELYRQAYELLPARERRAQRSGLIMAAIYSTLLAEIEREQFRVLTHRVSLTPVRKLWLAWVTWLRGRPPAP